MNTPAPPPEATLIRIARQAAGLSIATAAQKALISISTPRWSQVENGYEVRRGKHKPVRGRDETIAHMAYAVGVTPERLAESRPDAAEVLHEIVRLNGPGRAASRRATADIELSEEEVRVAVEMYRAAIRARMAEMATEREAGDRSA